MDAGGGMVDYWAESAGGLEIPRVLVCFRTSPVWVGFAWAAHRLVNLLAWFGLTAFTGSVAIQNQFL